jgi:hypothetical protein
MEDSCSLSGWERGLSAPCCFCPGAAPEDGSPTTPPAAVFVAVVESLGTPWELAWGCGWSKVLPELPAYPVALEVVVLGLGSSVGMVWSFEADPFCEGVSVDVGCSRDISIEC